MNPFNLKIQVFLQLRGLCTDVLSRACTLLLLHFLFFLFSFSHGDYLFIRSPRCVFPISYPIFSCMIFTSFPSFLCCVFETVLLFDPPDH